MVILERKMYFSMDVPKRKEVKSIKNQKNFLLSCKKYMMPINIKIAVLPFKKTNREQPE